MLQCIIIVTLEVLIVKDRTLIVFGVIITLLLIRLDFKTETLNNRVDQIEEIIIKTNHGINYTKHDVECLTKNIYYEAGNQTDIGKYAVATVTLNRIRAGRWGNTVCSVVYAPYQFSWTLLKRLHKPDPDLYARSHTIALNALKGYRVKGLEKSLLYHADYIKAPNWADPNNRIKQIGDHIFYSKGKGSTIEI